MIDGVAATPFDAVAKNTFILFGDATHVLGPMGTYANHDRRQDRDGDLPADTRASSPARRRSRRA